MEQQHNYVAIMAGGIGSRFWPQSRVSYPKQFLDILNTGKRLSNGPLSGIASLYRQRTFLLLPRRNIRLL
jgi:mannose-1-phosphate guanylyltransferase